MAGGDGGVSVPWVRGVGGQDKAAARPGEWGAECSAVTQGSPGAGLAWLSLSTEP